LVTAKKDAIPAARASLAAKGEGPNPSFISCARRWARLKAAEVAPSTAALYHTIVEAHLAASPFAERPVSAVSSNDLRDWAATLPGQSKTRHNVVSAAVSVLKASGNPARTKLPSVRHPDRRVLAPSERKAAFAISQPEAWLIVRLALGMGLRRSECAGLRHDDRQDDGVIVRRGVTSVDGTLYVGHTKTAVSNDWTPLHPDLLEIVGAPGSEGYVLGPQEPDPRRLSRVLEASLAKAGVLRAGFQALRRTYGTWLLELGVDVRTAAELMRHDPSMLMRQYARSRRELMRDAQGRLFPATDPATFPDDSLQSRNQNQA
jgi:integrase